MEANIQNFNFLKDTVNRFKGELQKLVATSKYSNMGIMKLRDNIEEIEKSIQNQEKYLVNSYLNNKKSISSTHKMLYTPSPLPLIKQPVPRAIGYIPDDDVYISVKYEKQSKLDRLKQHKKKREINQEKIDFINNMKKRKPMGKIKLENMARVAAFNKEKETKSLLNKYGINSDFYYNIKVTSRMPNYMNPSKRIQYSAFNKLPKANIVLYDENNQPIIKKEELEKGLYNMVNKGLIPKGADLSPAFENNGGNPMQINMRFKEDFKKKVEKDEILLGDKNHMKADMSKRGNYNDSDGFFITKPQDIINIGSNNIKPIDIINENKEITDIEENKVDTQENELISEQNVNLNNIKENNEMIMNKKSNKKVLIISNFQPVKNEEYYLFYNNNIDIWGQINYLLEHLGKLFKKLNLNLVEIYQDKLISLAKDETRVIQNKDLLNCITEKDLIDKGLNPNDTMNLYTTLKERFALKGPCNTFITACSSSAGAIIKAAQLIKSGICDAVIAGGVDIASDTALLGFGSLEAISPTPTNPFSKNRHGITLGEASVFFVLSREDLDKTGITLAGYSESADAYHMTSPDPEGTGAALAMESALKSAGLTPKDIGYLNLHGTGTKFNDSMESKAVDKVFGSVKVPCSSTKGTTGHTLGAAAALELSVCFEVLQSDKKEVALPAQHWDKLQDEELPVLNIVNEGDVVEGIHACMSNSFAFGGSNASLIISKE